MILDLLKWRHRLIHIHTSLCYSSSYCFLLQVISISMCSSLTHLFLLYQWGPSSSRINSKELSNSKAVTLDPYCCFFFFSFFFWNKVVYKPPVTWTQIFFGKYLQHLLDVGVMSSCRKMREKNEIQCKLLNIRTRAVSLFWYLASFFYP